MVSTRTVMACALAAAALAATGCGSSASSTSSTSSTPIATAPRDTLQALGAVSDSPTARTYFEWSHLRAVRQLARAPDNARSFAHATPDQRWLKIFGVGTNGLAGMEPVITSKTGIDIFAADSAVGIGQAPNAAMRIFGPGVDSAAITRSLTAIGAKHQTADGRAFLAMGAERSVNVNSPLALLGIVNQLDRAVGQGDTFAAGSAVAPVIAVLGGGRSLAADPAYKAAAGCLGDVVAAAIAPPASLNVSTPAQLLAVGVRRPPGASAPIVEVLCAVDPPGGNADAQTAGLRATLGGSSRVPGDTQRMNSVVGSRTVAVIQQGSLPVVRALITLQRNQPAGFLYRLLLRGSLGALIGSERQPEQP